MKRIGRRIFYELGAGSVIKDTGEKQGLWLVDTTIEQDILTWKELSERNRDTFDVIELPFGAYTQDFAEARLIGVDLERKIPLFAYPDPNSPGEEITPSVPLSVQIDQTQKRVEETENAILMLMDMQLMGGM